MKREIIGQGFEHTVFQASTDIPTVLKVPKPLTTLSMIFTPNKATAIREEIATSVALLEGSQVRVPETRVFAYHNSYVIAQEYLPEDGSLSKEDFFSHEPEEVRLDYLSHPKNYVAHAEKVYKVDLTFGGYSPKTFALLHIDRKEYLRMRAKINMLGGLVKEKINSLRGN